VYPGSFDPPTIAHVAIAEAAVRAAALDHLDFAISRAPLGKDATNQRSLETRLGALERLASTRPPLGVVVTDHRLITDIAADYDVVVMGADKWAQVFDPAWYGGSLVARDEAVARLPRVAVVTRPGVVLPDAEALGGVLLVVPDHHGDVSSSAARAGRREWMTPEAAEFDERTGAWTDAARYAQWRAATRAADAE
jgi:hypothetical protein